MGTEVTVVLRNRDYADLVDVETGEVIVKGRPVAEIQERADRVNAIWARREAEFLASLKREGTDPSPPAEESRRIREGEVISPPSRIDVGMICRVVSRDGQATPELWMGSHWKEGSGTYLADMLTGRELSASQLEEAGIPE